MDCGFLIFDQGKGYLGQNNIFANPAGVEIKNKADPILYQNNMHHRQTGGEYIHEKVCPVFVNCMYSMYVCVYSCLGCTVLLEL